MKSLGLVLGLLVLGLLVPVSVTNTSNMVNDSVVDKALPEVKIVNVELVHKVKDTGNLFILGESHVVRGFVDLYNPGVEPVKVVNLTLIYPVDFGRKCKILIGPLENFKPIVVNPDEKANIIIDSGISVPCGNSFRIVISYCGIYSGICGHVSTVVEVGEG